MASKPHQSKTETSNAEPKDIPNNATSSLAPQPPPTLPPLPSLTSSTTPHTIYPRPQDLQPPPLQPHKRSNPCRKRGRPYLRGGPDIQFPISPIDDLNVNEPEPLLEGLRSRKARLQSLKTRGRTTTNGPPSRSASASLAHQPTRLEDFQTGPDRERVDADADGWGFKFEGDDDDEFAPQLTQPSEFHSLRPSTNSDEAAELREFMLTHDPLFVEGPRAREEWTDDDDGVLGAEALPQFSNDLDDEEPHDKGASGVQGILEIGIAQSREDDFGSACFGDRHRHVKRERGVPGGLIALARRRNHEEEEESSVGATTYQINEVYQRNMVFALTGKVGEADKGLDFVTRSVEVDRATDSGSVAKGLQELDSVEQLADSWMEKQSKRRRIRSARVQAEPVGAQ